MKNWTTEEIAAALEATPTQESAEQLMTDIAAAQGLEIIENILITDPHVFADDGNAEEEYEKDTTPQEASEMYVSNGEWGDEGGEVEVKVYHKGIDVNGEEAETDGVWITVDIPVDQESLIAAAASGHEICRPEQDGHDWTSEGEVGLDENPGVWSHGGTTMSFDSHCRKCGLHRHTVNRGFQRNPGEAEETVAYRMLDADEIAAHRENGTMDDADEN